MLIRVTKAVGGKAVGEVMDAPNGQAERLLKLGVAIPVEQGPDGRITIKRGTRKIPRRDRTEQVDAVD